MTQKQLTGAEQIEFLVERDGSNCFHPECGKEFKDESDITLDHWIPRSLGGTWDIENLRLMHKRCNAIKGDRMPNADGTLPVLHRDLNSAQRRAVKQQSRADVCMKCNNGRSLGPDEFCDSCGSIPMPFRHPQWAKLNPNDCDHEGIWWCWCCMSGIIERKPAILDVLNSDQLDE